MSNQENQRWMCRAIELARKGEGRTAPNPPVGAVVVQQGALVGEGYHPEAGAPHAEVFALRQAGDLSNGATLYVTLEPCSHFGKTPPCADAVIAAGIQTVYVGAADPNPQVAGRGVDKLRAAGVTVHVGLLDEECRRLIAPFKKQILTGLPYTIYKSAMTLDGNTAAASGDSRWVSCAESRHRVHQLRNRVDAIMVGVETVIADDPLLNTRLDDDDCRDPLRIVIDSRLRTPPQSRMLSQSSSAGTLIATVSNDEDRIERLRASGADVLVVPEQNSHVSLPDLWHLLGQRNIQRLLLEGGPTLASAALEAGLIDQVMFFVAPKLLGGRSAHGVFNGRPCELMAEAIKLKDQRLEQVGTDFLMTGEIDSCLQD